MIARVSLGALVLGVALASPIFASDVGYIYGRVVTEDGDTYQGQLRWGTEESFWDDLFNANKVENQFVDQLDRKTRDRLRRSRRDNGDWDEWDNWGFLFGHRGYATTHLFAIRFGDLKRIRVRHGDDLVVTFRNGEELRLEGGSNDVGAEITVVDPRLGQHRLRWNRIRTIDFSDTPARLTNKLGDPIFGTVKSGKLEFTGRIQWDNDECLTIDKLDGETEDGKASIAFSDIAAIRRQRGGALVKLKSGSEVFLDGSNDVNDENRGVVVVVKGVGSVKIGWKDFDQVVFSPAPGTGRSYAEYATGRDLAGTVVTRDGSHDGRVVFDLDESWFRDIARIVPKGSRRTEVVLHNGLRLELEDSQDVTRDNDGLLVFTGSGKPDYIAWRDVTEVVFR
jgi:hypothetical protein